MANDRSDKWLMLYKMFDSRGLCILVFKFATNGQSDKAFCWDQNFDPKALSTPAQGLYTRENT